VTISRPTASALRLFPVAGHGHDEPGAVARVFSLVEVGYPPAQGQAVGEGAAGHRLGPRFKGVSPGDMMPRLAAHLASSRSRG